MSKNVVVNGTTYIIPDQGDLYPWGTGQGGVPGLSCFFQALASSTLQLSGGSFPLSTDVDFGTSHGLKAGYYELGAQAPAVAPSNKCRLQSSAGGRFQVSENGGGFQDVLVTLAAVGSSPSANGASLSGSQITLQPADGTRPGVVTAGAQHIGGAKTFDALLTVAAALQPKLTSGVAASVTLDATTMSYNANATGGNVTVNLPQASTCAGRIYVVSKSDSSGNTVTVTPFAGDTVKNTTTKVLASQGDVFLFISDGVSNWIVK